MKPKRRHELQTNALADWLGRTVQSLRPYSNHLFWGAIALAALVVVSSWLMAYWRSRSREPWTRLSEVLSRPPGFSLEEQQLIDLAQQYESVADDYPQSLAGRWARLLQADALRIQGVREVTSDRQKALVALRSAERLYRSLTEQPAGAELLDERALFGRAESLETLGELKEAREVYQKLLDRHPPQEIRVEADLAFKERLEAYLARRYAALSSADVVAAIDAGLIQFSADGSGQGQKASRVTYVQAGMPLRVQVQGVLTLEVQKRLNALNDPAVGDFYAWLATAQPPPVVSPEKGAAGIVPEFEAEPAVVPEFEPDSTDEKEPESKPAP